jgi:hypothetical protein
MSSTATRTQSNLPDHTSIARRHRTDSSLSSAPHAIGSRSSVEALRLWTGPLSQLLEFAMTFGRRFAAVLAALTLFLLVGAGSAAAQSRPDRPESSSSLAGAWRVDLLGFGPTSVPILMTFARDGTLLQTDTPVLLPQPVPPSSAASNGHGLWRKLGGRDYSFTYVKIFYGPDGPALATATQRARATLSDDGKTFTARIVGTDFVNADGSPIAPGAVATLTFTGTRIALPDEP